MGAAAFSRTCKETLVEDVRCCFGSNRSLANSVPLTRARKKQQVSNGSQASAPLFIFVTLFDMSLITQCHGKQKLFARYLSFADINALL